MIVRELINKIGFKMDEAAFRKSEKSFNSLVNKAQQTGLRMSAAITLPFAAFVTAAIRSRSVQSQAMAQVEQGLKSTGDTVGRTFDNLQQQASKFQERTLFGDESILQGVTAQLLTFTNITGEAFDRTQKAVLDVTTRIRGANAGGEALTATSIQLGKALNDPVANLGALSRSGIQFSKQQKEVIKSLAESGRLSEAQAMILTELEKQYGGAAEAARGAAFGFRTLSNSVGDLMEDFGKVLQPFFLKVNNVLEKVVKTLKERLTPELKTMLFIIGGAAAILGPLILAFTVLARVGLFVRGTLLAVAAAARLANLSTSMFLLKFALMGAGIIAAVMIGLAVFDDINMYLKGGDSLIGRLIDRLGELNEVLKNLGIFTLDNFKNVFDLLDKMMQSSMDALVGIFTGKWSFALDSVKQHFINSFKAIGNIMAASLQPLFDIRNKFTGEKFNIRDELAKSYRAAKIAIPESRQKAKEFFEHVKSRIPVPIEPGPISTAGGIITNQPIINATTNLTLPGNATPEQIEAVGKGVEKTVNEALRRASRSILNAFPETE